METSTALFKHQLLPQEILGGVPEPPLNPGQKPIGPADLALIFPWS